MDKVHLEEVLEFIRQNRSNEANFEKLVSKLQEESSVQNNAEEYRQSLKEIESKQVEEYRQNKETGASAWPQFENFISRFEKTITEFISKS